MRLFPTAPRVLAAGTCIATLSACPLVAGLDSDYSAGIGDAAPDVVASTADARGRDAHTAHDATRPSDARDASDRSDLGKTDGTNNADTTRPDVGNPPDAGRTDAAPLDAGRDVSPPPADAGHDGRKSDACTSNCGCPSGETMCGTTCVDVLTDDGNCGGCGQACGAIAPSTAACTAGRCLVTLAEISGFGAGIAVNGSTVYASNGGAIYAIPIPGGSATVFVSPTQPFQIALDSSSLYWTDFGGVVGKIPLAGGTITTLWSAAAAGSMNAPYYLATDGTNVYWTTETNSSTGTVVMTPVAGGTLTTLATAQTLTAGITVMGGNVVWTTAGIAASSGTVMSVPISGGSPTTLASSLDQPVVITHDTQDFYWTERDNPGSVIRLWEDDATPIVLASGQNLPTGIATDGLSVYWGDTNGGTIMKVPVGGGTPETLATGQVPQYLAVDNTSVYWTSSNGAGTVMKVTK